MRSLAIAAITVLALGIFTATATAENASRPATPSESLVYDHAAWHLRSIGVQVPAFDVSVGICGPNGYACSNPGHVVLSAEAAGEARRYAVAAGKRGRASRTRALIACDRSCNDSAQGALHELIHEARFPVAAEWDNKFEEGLAEAVAVDQFGPMMYRVSGWRNATSDGYIYASWVESVQAATGGLGYTGRRARLDAVASPNSLPIVGPDEGPVF